jgi:putative N6-adenine-specific DNA methylase
LSPGYATISLNSSGESLHRRGYRLEGSEASLRETLAAGLIRSTRWDRKSPLIDLTCGAGTIVIEAARLALGIPPGGEREHSYFRWKKGSIYPGFAEHQRQLQKLGAPAKPESVLAWGFDSDPKVIARARENAKRAGVDSVVRFEARPLAETRDLPQPGQAGVILCNPPYGERIGELEDLMNLYRELGDVLKHQAEGYHAAILTGSKRLAAAIGLRPSKRQPFSNGGLECRLLHFEIYSGSRKPSKNLSSD